MKHHHIIKWFIAVVVLLCLFCRCSRVRTEVFRNETLHLYRQGNVAYRSGDYDGAAEFYTRVIKLNPAYARAHVGLGNVAVLNQDFPEARKHYQSAMELEPQLKPEVTARLSEVAISPQSASLPASGIDWHKVCRLITAGQFRALDKLLSKYISLDFSIMASGSMPATHMAPCLDRIEQRVQTGKGSAAFMCFAGYALSVSDKTVYSAAAAFEQAAAAGDRNEKKKAYLALAALYDRIEDKDKAVEAYLKSVAAGVSMETVATELAALYGVPVEVVTGKKAAGASKK